MTEPTPDGHQALHARGPREVEKLVHSFRDRYRVLVEFLIDYSVVVGVVMTGSVDGFVGVTPEPADRFQQIEALDRGNDLLPSRFETLTALEGVAIQSQLILQRARAQSREVTPYCGLEEALRMGDDVDEAKLRPVVKRSKQAPASGAPAANAAGGGSWF